MELLTARLRLVPTPLPELRRAIRSGDLGRALGFYTLGYNAKKRREHRKIYRAKCRLMREAPDLWLFCTAWQLIEREQNVFVGEAGFKGGPSETGEVEIGYSMQESFRNRGYMTEAVGALCHFALAQRAVPVRVVSATTLPENVASHRVLEKCGFRRMGVRNALWLWLWPAR